MRNMRHPARDFGPRLWIAIVSGGASLSADNFYSGFLLLRHWQEVLRCPDIYFTLGKVIEARGPVKSGQAQAKSEAVRERQPGAGEEQSYANTQKDKRAEIEEVRRR